MKSMNSSGGCRVIKKLLGRTPIPARGEGLQGQETCSMHKPPIMTWREEISERVLWAEETASSSIWREDKMHVGQSTERSKVQIMRYFLERCGFILEMQRYY